MALHLLKMAVGVDSVLHLSRLQAARLRQAPAAGQVAELRHLTRNRPRRSAEINDGGSIYWIIKGYVRVRQRISRLDSAVNTRGEPRCAIILDPDLVPTVLKPHRPLRGWRYLETGDAPSDSGLPHADDSDVPPEMAAELRQLGLL